MVIEEKSSAYNGVSESKTIGGTVQEMQFAKKSFRLNPGQRNILALFCAGLLAGILVLYIGKSILLENTGLFDEDTLYHMKYMTVDSSALFCYILRKRIGKLLILAVLSTTYLGLAACMGTVFWYGMSAGVLLASLTIRYGVKGIVLAVISIFPQYLIYVPVMLVMLTWCETVFRGIYHRNGGGYEAVNKGFLLRQTGQLAAIIAAMTAGCLAEGYINPYILKGFLKIF